MFEQMKVLALGLGVPEQTLLIAGVGFGVLMVILGIAAIVNERDPAADRIAAMREERRFDRSGRGLLNAENKDPTGVWKAMIPTDLDKRADLTRKLARAGFASPTALRTFTVVRLFLGLGLPSILILSVMLARLPGLVLPPVIPAGPVDWLASLSDTGLARITIVLVAIGYFFPIKWLNGRAAARQRKIEEAFPNALDLMQVSVSAGLGFDAAMTRVGNELAAVSPEIAFEFLTVQRQIQAGRPRDAAMRDMALRTGVDTVRSFANVVAQSISLGTPMSEALNAYADEMRTTREMNAQEAANKLPVKFSAVLASLMLPALVMLTVGPVVIRYIRFFEG